MKRTRESQIAVYRSLLVGTGLMLLLAPSSPAAGDEARQGRTQTDAAVEETAEQGRTAPAAADPAAPVERVIVQSSTMAAAAATVTAVGGRVTHELGIIRAVGAELMAAQRAELTAGSEGVRLYADAAATVDSTACAVAGGYRLLESNKLLWHLTNAGGAAVTLSGLYLEWPSANGVLKKIKLDGDDIYTQQTMPPAVTVTSGWQDDASRRRIEAGETVELKLEFGNAVSFTESNYKLFVSFAEGCTVELAPQAWVVTEDKKARDTKYPTLWGRRRCTSAASPAAG